jgi:K+-transporting ATPase A subunit
MASSMPTRHLWTGLVTNAHRCRAGRSLGGGNMEGKEVRIGAYGPLTFYAIDTLRSYADCALAF